LVVAGAVVVGADDAVVAGLAALVAAAGADGSARCFT
jgi:hypothetical protein